MSRWLNIAVLTIAAGAVLLVGANASASSLLGVRFGPGPEKTRVVIDIAGDVEYAISGDTSAEGRLLIDFKGLSVESNAFDYRPGRGHIARYGFARGADGEIRAILEFKKTARIKEAFMIPPAGGVSKHRLVIDLTPSDKEAFLASLPQPFTDLAGVIAQATRQQPPAAEEPVVTAQSELGSTGVAMENGKAIPPAPSRKSPSLAENPTLATPPQKAGEPIVIVIDAGHGGADPGAQGQSGTLEKNVNLWAALELAEILGKNERYQVVLTRAGDKKIKPDRREVLARDAGADLFISLHADAISTANVRGGSVYTLSEQGSARSAKIAKSQGDYHVYDLDVGEFSEDVGNILFDVAQGVTKNGSRRFAEILIDKLHGKTPLLNRSLRTADLRILLAPDVPAVLFEMAFISNSKDEANLNSPVWRKRTMQAVADAIDAYFDEKADQRLAASRVGGSN